jgi:hypothetical protein
LTFSPALFLIKSHRILLIQYGLKMILWAAIMNMGLVRLGNTIVQGVVPGLGEVFSVAAAVVEEEEKAERDGRRRRGQQIAASLYCG